MLLKKKARKKIPGLSLKTNTKLLLNENIKFRSSN